MTNIEVIKPVILKIKTSYYAMEYSFSIVLCNKLGTILYISHDASQQKNN
jgi:hypothetical protein